MLIEQNKISIHYINRKNKLANNFTKTLNLFEFQNYYIKIEITLIKKVNAIKLQS